MKSRAFCMSLSRRTEDFPDRLEEYATMWGTTKSGANYRILNEWEKLKKDTNKAIYRIKKIIGD